MTAVQMESDSNSEGTNTSLLSPATHHHHPDSDSGLSVDCPPEKPPVPPHTSHELAYSVLQIFASYTVAGFGLVMAGLLLDEVQHWEVFLKVDELFILVPPLLGLKGNLEMTLAARLSTAANLGQVDTWRGYLSVVAYNLILVQGQAIIVSVLASLLSVLLGLLVSWGQIDWSLVPLIFLSATLAACMSGLVLGVAMALVVYLCATFKLNPDNFATPVAAAMGDLVTLGALSLVASGLYEDRQVTLWLGPLIVSLLLPLAATWLWLSTKSDSTREVVRYGWAPILIAMCISSLGGMVLDKVVAGLEGIAVYAPVINGTGGNLAAVQACRISTSLHTRGSPGNHITDTEVQFNSLFHIILFTMTHLGMSKGQLDKLKNSPALEEFVKSFEALVVKRRAIIWKLRDLKENAKKRKANEKVVKTLGALGAVGGALLLFTPLAPISTGITALSSGAVLGTQAIFYLTDTDTKTVMNIHKEDREAVNICDAMLTRFSECAIELTRLYSFNYNIAAALLTSTVFSFGVGTFPTGIREGSRFGAALSRAMKCPMLQKKCIECMGVTGVKSIFSKVCLPVSALIDVLAVGHEWCVDKKVDKIDEILESLQRSINRISTLIYKLSEDFAKVDLEPELLRSKLSF